MRPALLALMALALPPAGCSLITTFDDTKQTEDSFGNCRDDSDNDGDGLVDCDDLDCVTFSFCEELTLAACSNGKDDDGDGDTDCLDIGCKVHESICSEKTIDACSNNVDDDGDGLIDCKDPDCRTLKLCQETTAAACADKLDNDSDGLIDCLDFDCFESRESCCKIAATPFTGDSFTYNPACKNDPCLGGQGCCTGMPDLCCTGTFECHSFDPTRWVVWGWPRPRLESGGFIANKPCSCESSGIVSVEQVHLTPPPASVKVLAKGDPVLKLEFNLTAPSGSSLEEYICGGLTTGVLYSDEVKQCSSAGDPRLLAGICLTRAGGGSTTPDAGPGDAGPDSGKKDAGLDSGPKDAGLDSGPKDAGLDSGPKDAGLDSGPKDATAGDLAADAGGSSGLTADDIGAGGAPRLRVIIDGQVMVQSVAAMSGAVACKVEISQDGFITATAGGVTYRSQTGIASSLMTAKVVAYGHGANARLDSLVVKDLGATANRCQAPRAWYRHLSRGAPVIRAATAAGDQAALTEVRASSVIFNAVTAEYLMAFAGRLEIRKPKPETKKGIFQATSQNGVLWTVAGGATPKRVLIAPSGGDLASPTLLRDGTRLHLWYAVQLTSGSGAWSIRHATSSDGKTWTEDAAPNAGLTPAAGSAWDSLSVSDPAVVKRPDGAGFYMWYTGTSRTTGSQPAIGLASSSDGSVWVRVGTTPLISPQANSSDLAMEEPAVKWDSNLRLYRMWHTRRTFGQPSTLTYSVSLDGKIWNSWTKGAAFGPGAPGAFDERGVSSATVRLSGSRIQLWYSGLDLAGKYHIGFAENRGSL